MIKPINPHALIVIQENPTYYLGGFDIPRIEILKYILKSIKNGTIDQIVFGWDYPSDAELVAHDIQRRETRKGYLTREYFKEKYSQYRYQQRQCYLESKQRPL